MVQASDAPSGASELARKRQLGNLHARCIRQYDPLGQYDERRCSHRGGLSTGGLLHLASAREPDSELELFDQLIPRGAVMADKSNSSSLLTLGLLAVGGYVLYEYFLAPATTAAASPASTPAAPAAPATTTAAAPTTAAPA